MAGAEFIYGTILLSNQVVHILTTILLAGTKFLFRSFFWKMDYFFSQSLSCFRTIQVTKAEGSKRNTQNVWTSISFQIKENSICEVALTIHPICRRFRPVVRQSRISVFKWRMLRFFLYPLLLSYCRMANFQMCRPDRAIKRFPQRNAPQGCVNLANVSSK